MIQFGYHPKEITNKSVQNQNKFYGDIRLIDPTGKNSKIIIDVTIGETKNVLAKILTALRTTIGYEVINTPSDLTHYFGYHAKETTNEKVPNKMVLPKYLAFSILHFAFCILHFAFCILHSQSLSI